MTVPSEPPRQGFHARQLVYDTRYRSITIQVAALATLGALLFFLVSNLVQNLADLGKDINFSFLWQRAGYDINQMLIPYDSSMSHGRAALVGIANTLLVALLGCAMATVLGIAAGVLRLSKNWIVARLMAVYVEGFRNVPLVLWILLIYAVFTEATPAPRAFAEGGTASMIMFDTVAVTNRGVYLPRPVWGEGSLILVIVLSLSILAVFLYRRWVQRQLFDKGRILPLLFPSIAIVILPVLATFFLLGRPLSFEVPTLGGFNFEGGLQVRNSLTALWLALSLYTGAFIAENVRAGVLAVSRGQSEAAFALGLRPNRAMQLVILPQALRVIIPPLISQYLNLTKNSSLAIAVGYMDVRATLGGITINQTGRELEGILLLGAFYLSVSLLISFVMNIYNRSIMIKER
jgi:general L-amino acid transport system permease protein